MKNLKISKSGPNHGANERPKGEPSRPYGEYSINPKTYKIFRKKRALLAVKKRKIFEKSGLDSYMRDLKDNEYEVSSKCTENPYSSK